MRSVTISTTSAAVVASFLASLGVGAAERVQPAQQAQEVQQAQRTEQNHFTGIVIAVDASRSMLTVEQASLDAVQRSFELSDRTELMKDAGSIALSDIEVGDPVTVTYDMRADANAARSVKVITAPGT